MKMEKIEKCDVCGEVKKVTTHYYLNFVSGWEEWHVCEECLKKQLEEDEDEIREHEENIRELVAEGLMTKEEAEEEGVLIL